MSPIRLGGFSQGAPLDQSMEQRKKNTTPTFNHSRIEVTHVLRLLTTPRLRTLKKLHEDHAAMVSNGNSQKHISSLLIVPYSTTSTIAFLLYANTEHGGTARKQQGSYSFHDVGVATYNCLHSSSRIKNNSRLCHPKKYEPFDSVQ